MKAGGRDGIHRHVAGIADILALRKVNDEGLLARLLRKRGAAARRSAPRRPASCQYREQEEQTKYH